jgi:hypothetical protein
MTTPDFLRAQPEHAKILLESVRAYYAFDGIGFEADRVRRAILQLLESPFLGEAWLIRDRGDFVGHFVISFGFDIEFGGQQATLTEFYLEERPGPWLSRRRPLSAYQTCPHTGGNDHA